MKAHNKPRPQMRSLFACALLLALGADATAADKDRETALHHAAYYGHVDALQTLVEWGGVALLDAKSRPGGDPNARALTAEMTAKGSRKAKYRGHSFLMSDRPASSHVVISQGPSHGRCSLTRSAQ